MVNQLGKKFFTIFLWVVALQILLPFIVLCTTSFIKLYQQDYIARNARRSELFTELRIAVDDTSVQFHGKDELTYKGTWYDIKSIKVDNGEYVIAAKADKHETALQKINTEQSIAHTQGQKLAKKMLPFLFLFYEKQKTWQCTIAEVPPKHSMLYQFSLLTQSIEVIIPPPLV